jgi:uncharacterized membrane protein
MNLTGAIQHRQEDLTMSSNVPDREVLQLQRLSTLADVVYAITIWRIFLLIPRPGINETNWSSLGEYFRSEWLALLVLLVGLIFTIVYWLQNNKLSSRLTRTDTKHTVLSIVQIFSVLLFLYSLRMGIEIGDAIGARFFESLAAANVGLWGALAWRYACKNRHLLRDDVTDLEARQIAVSITGEPLTAAVTIPFAFVGPIFWNLSWFAYPVIAGIVRKRANAMKE